MEVYNLIISSIGSLGFPIVMALMLLKQMNDMTNAHKEEINGLKDTINQNTIVLQKLCDKIGDE